MVYLESSCHQWRTRSVRPFVPSSAIPQVALVAFIVTLLTRLRTPYSIYSTPVQPGHSRRAELAMSRRKNHSYVCRTESKRTRAKVVIVEPSSRNPRDHSMA